MIVDKFTKYPCSPKILPLVYDESLSYYEDICKLIEKVNEVVGAIEGLELEVLEKAYAYTDSQITERLADVESRYNAFAKEVRDTLTSYDEKMEQFEGEIVTQFNAFKDLVNARMNFTDNYVRELTDKIDNFLVISQKYTDVKVSQNNDHIIEELEGKLGDIRVLNYFTGAKVSIQEMFDYLASLHVTDGIAINTLVGRALTVQHIVDLDAKLTDIALHGNTVLV